MGGDPRRWAAIGCLVLMLLAGCSSKPDTDEIAAWVKTDLQSYLDRDPKVGKYRLEVLDVDLIHSSGNDYKGFATVRTPRLKEHKIGMTVTYDGDKGMWEADRGAFLFLMDEPAATRP